MPGISTSQAPLLVTVSENYFLSFSLHTSKSKQVGHHGRDVMLLQHIASHITLVSCITSRLGQRRRLTIFLGASHRLENMKCARIMKNGVD